MATIEAGKEHDWNSLGLFLTVLLLDLCGLGADTADHAAHLGDGRQVDQHHRAAIIK